MDVVEAPCLFNEAQQTLNRELTQHKVKVRELTEKRDTYKLLSKKLKAEVEAARKEHAEWVEQVNRVLVDSDDNLDTVANDPNMQVQKRLEHIGKLQAQVDTIKAEVEEWKKNMYLLASKKEDVQAQLASAEAQLRAAEGKTSTQDTTIEEIQLEIAEVKAEADKKVAQHKVDAEAAKDQAKYLVEHMKWQARREALEEVQAQGFDLMAEIENAKISEVEVRNLAYPEEEDSDGFEDSDELDGGEEPEGEDASLDEDQAP
ncbi:uncharacterized protein [Nicotiana sylvestris]|uniref:uncharacterized protein n=1 Tax=Nicotiana sylvestris TaxID=4096 RepID=UPI00388C378B